MKFTFQIIFILLFIGCDIPINNNTTLTPPVIVEKTQSDNQFELGIDSDNRLKSGIILMWFSSQNTNVQGYSIYRGNETTNSNIEYDFLGRTFINDEFSYDTLYFDTSAVEYVKYFYFIRAEGLDGNHSEPSDTVSYTISSGPSAISPINTVSDSFPIFRWVDNVSNFQYTSEFIIRIEKLMGNDIETIWVSKFYNIWFGFENTTPISFPFFPATSYWGEQNNTFHSNAPSNLISCFGIQNGMHEGSYRWKIKAINETNANGVDEMSGESSWKYFDITF